MYENYNNKIYKYIFHQSLVSNFHVGFVIWNPLQKVQAQFALRESCDNGAAVVRESCCRPAACQVLPSLSAPDRFVTGNDVQTFCNFLAVKFVTVFCSSQTWLICADI
jgi:hypothetical protein